MLKPAALPFVPANANFREGIVGAVELATGGETPTLRPPCVVTRDEGPSPTTKTYAPRSRPQGAFLRRWNRPIISFVLRLSQHQRPGAPGIGAISG
jgi:hypothetical protein